jgi:hypothetical protein
MNRNIISAVLIMAALFGIMVILSCERGESPVINSGPGCPQEIVKDEPGFDGVRIVGPEKIFKIRPGPSVSWGRLRRAQRETLARIIITVTLEVRSDGAAINEEISGLQNPDAASHVFSAIRYWRYTRGRIGFIKYRFDPTANAVIVDTTGLSPTTEADEEVPIGDLLTNISGRWYSVFFRRIGD